MRQRQRGQRLRPPASERCNLLPSFTFFLWLRAQEICDILPHGVTVITALLYGHRRERDQPRESKKQGEQTCHHDTSEANLPIQVPFSGEHLTPEKTMKNLNTQVPNLKIQNSKFKNFKSQVFSLIQSLTGSATSDISFLHLVLGRAVRIRHCRATVIAEN